MTKFASIDIRLKQSRQDTIKPPTSWKGKVIIRNIRNIVQILFFKYIAHGAVGVGGVI